MQNFIFFHISELTLTNIFSIFSCILDRKSFTKGLFQVWNNGSQKNSAKRIETQGGRKSKSFQA